jgi:deoxyribodipyrimidine photo-lyase
VRRILWFRRDLRIDDNPLLSLKGEVLPLFIFDPAILGHLEKNDPRVTFIFHTLLNLKTALKEHGLDLALFYGNPTEVFEWLIKEGKFDTVCASGDYDPYSRQRDRDVSHLLTFEYLHDTYIFRPDEILKNDKTPYLVFTPFYHRAKALFRPEHMDEYLPSPQSLIPFDFDHLHSIVGSAHSVRAIAPESIGFTQRPLPPNLNRTPEEKLTAFASKISTYTDDRDVMEREGTSHLGSDLRFGTLSIRSVLRWLLERKKEGIDTEPFFRELMFREFYAMLLYHFPHLTHENFRYPFKGIENTTFYEAFCTARTGVPIVDAGIRELLATGEMHNRVRMIAASFFTKNLLLPWQWGEAFFAAHLNDYDAASNILSWQWSAGTGVDPQPYFRIFNPYTQSAKFDPEGTYIRRWVPELSPIGNKELHSEEKLRALTIESYPKPIVEHRGSSQKALDYFKSRLK